MELKYVSCTQTKLIIYLKICIKNAKDFQYSKKFIPFYENVTHIFFGYSQICEFFCEQSLFIQELDKIKWKAVKLFFINLLFPDLHEVPLVSDVVLSNRTFRGMRYSSNCKEVPNSESISPLRMESAE